MWLWFIAFVSWGCLLLVWGQTSSSWGEFVRSKMDLILASVLVSFSVVNIVFCCVFPAFVIVLVCILYCWVFMVIRYVYAFLCVFRVGFVHFVEQWVISVEDTVPVQVRTHFWANRPQDSCCYADQLCRILAFRWAKEGLAERRKHFRSAREERRRSE